MTLAVLVFAWQTIQFVLSLPEAWGLVEIVQGVETDGDPSTKEALIYREDDRHWRVVAVRADGAICAGPWFYFADYPFLQPKIWRKGAVDVAYFTGYENFRSHYVEMELAHPTECQP